MIRLKARFDFFLLIILFYLPAFLFPQKIDFDFQNKYADYLQQYYQNKKIPSISAGVLKNGKINWIGVKGLIDLENFIEAKTNSLYRIASITKPITAVAVMKLYEKGLIDLDADITNYVDYFPKKKWKITVRNILNHTSGIRTYKSEDEFNSVIFYNSTKEAVLTFANDDLLFEPGTNYHYSSLAYSLLAALVENVTKMSFEEYLKKEIFQIANMNSTKIDKHREIIHNRVKGYEKSLDRKFINAPLADLSIKVAGGGLISNAEDILNFANALLEFKLISKSTFEIMTTPTVLKTGKTINYGLGFSLSDKNDSLKYFGHEGRGTGFSTALIIDPIDKIATVYLINIRDRNLDNPARDLLLIAKGYEKFYVKKNISDFLFEKYEIGGLDSVLTNFNDIYTNFQSDYNLSDEEIALFGEALAKTKSFADGIRFLRIINKKITNSFFILKSLGKLYYKNSNNGLAIRYFREAQLINPNDPYVNRMINIISKR